jgi:hypothetical protein
MLMSLDGLMGWSRVFEKYLETFMNVVKPVEEERTLQQEIEQGAERLNSGMVEGTIYI